MKNVFHFAMVFAGAILLVGCSSPVSPSGSNTPLNLDFTSSDGGAYLAQGTAAGDNFNLVTTGGMPSITVHSTSVTNNGYTGETVDWALSGPTNMSGQDYTVSFEYYIPSSPATNITGIRMEFYDYAASYTPIFFNPTTTLTPADTWLTFSMTVTAGNVAYDGFGTGGVATPSAWTALDHFRITATSASASQDVLMYVTNVKVTNAP